MSTKNSMNVTGERIAQLRKKNKLTQGDFALKLSDYMKRSKIMGISAVSSWEVGRKDPSAPVLKAISEMFGVSLDWLTGQDISELPESPGIISNDGFAHKESVRKVSKDKIRREDLASYNSRPVFAVFQDKSHRDQWGILDYVNSKIVFLNNLTLDISYEGMELYPFEIYDFPRFNKRTQHMLRFEKMKETDQIWVEMNSADDFVRAEWNGWYVHNKQRTALINIANGNVLPYRGYGKSFRAYYEPFDVVDYK